jgi:hypothetical protein
MYSKSYHKVFKVNDLSVEQVQKLLDGVVFVFESNYRQYAIDDASEKAYKFMAQTTCHSIVNKAIRQPELIDDLLKDALNRIIRKS